MGGSNIGLNQQNGDSHSRNRPRASGAKPKYFLSAVSSEFRSLRVRIDSYMRQLGFETEVMDHAGTDAGDLFNILRERIDECDGIIHIVGHAYGAEPLDPHPEYGRISYTQYEYLYAKDKGLRTFVFLAADEVEREPSVEELDSDSPEKQRLQMAYYKRLEQSRELWHDFSDADELERKISTLRTEVDRNRREFRDGQKRGERNSRLTLKAGLAILCAIVLLSLGVWAVYSKAVEAEKKLAALIEQREITEQSLRDVLIEAANKHLAEQTEAAAGLKNSAERTKRLNQAVNEHQRAIARVESVASGFAAVLGAEGQSAETADVLKRMNAFINDETVPPAERLDRALAVLDEERAELKNRLRARRDLERAALRADLEPLRQGAELARSESHYDDAASYYRDILDQSFGDPGWAQVRYEFWEMLMFEWGPHADIYDKLTKVGDIYDEAFRHARKLDADDPDNPKWERSLGVSHNPLGDFARNLGDLNTAENHYLSAYEISQDLVGEDESNDQWQGDLALSSNRLGDLAKKRGKLSEAGKHYTFALEIRERLAASDTGNSQWQRDVSFNFNRLGDLARSRRDFSTAGKHYESALEISKRLVAGDVNNTNWQRDLAVSYDKLGDLSNDLGDLIAAKEHYTSALRIRERVAGLDLSAAEWQTELAISHWKVGTIIAELALQSFFSDADGVQLDFAEALNHVRSGHVILDDLRGQNRLDPTQQDWIPKFEGKLAFLSSLPETGKQVFENFLKDPGNPSNFQVLLYQFRSVVSSLLKSGKIDEAASQQEQFLELLSEAVNAGNPLVIDPKTYSNFVSMLGNHAFKFVKFSRFDIARRSAESALSIDDTQIWIYGNLAHALLLSGDRGKAEMLHRQNKGKKIFSDSEDSMTWEAATEADFNEFSEAGIHHPDMFYIADLLDIEWEPASAASNAQSNE